MTLDSPALLAVGLLVTAALGTAAALLRRRRAAALVAMGGAGAARAGPLGVWLTVVGIGLLSIAAAGPVASLPVPRVAGTVILALDVSGSMGADDVSPTRLGAAQNAARAFIRAQPESVDIGVVAFEHGSLITAAPSGDHQAAMAAVDRLTVTGGTSLAAAIAGALSAITGQSLSLPDEGPAPDIGYWPSATVVMFTDGEDQAGGQAGDGPASIAAAADTAQRAGIAIHTIGVGTQQGAVVTVDEYRLHTALDSQTLEAIARTTGGTYQPASEAALDSVTGNIEQRLTVSNEDIPLAGGFILVALTLLAAGATATILRSGRVI